MTSAPQHDEPTLNPRLRDEVRTHIREHARHEAARIERLPRVREFVLGAQDGLLVPLGVVTGMAAVHPGIDIRPELPAHVGDQCSRSGLASSVRPLLSDATDAR